MEMFNTGTLKKKKKPIPLGTYSSSQKSSEDTSQSSNTKSVHATSELSYHPDSATLIQMRKITRQQISWKS